MKKKWKRPVTD